MPINGDDRTEEMKPVINDKRKKRRYVLLALGVAALAAVAAGITFVILISRPEGHKGLDYTRFTKSGTKTLNSTYDLNYRSPYTKPDSDEIDWDRIRSLSACRFGLNAAGSQANVPVKGRLKVELEPEEVQLPETLNVYRMRPLVQSEAEFRRIAGKFGLGEGTLIPASICIADNTPQRLAYAPDADWLEYINDKVGGESVKALRAPSEKQCVKIATEIARKTGLLPPGGRVIAKNTTEGSNSNMPDGLLLVETWDIIFGMDVDGYKIRGPGMRLRVRIGVDGKLVYLRSNLKKLELLGTYPVKPLEQALAEAQEGKDTLNLQPDAQDPTVNSVDILYYSDSSGRDNELLMPVYALMGSDCMIYVPAVVQ